MNRREFHFSLGTSNKFWAITLQGSSFTVHFGKVGTAGQAQTKEFSTEAAALKEHTKLVTEKIKKGYVETIGKASSATTIPEPTLKASAKTDSANAVSAAVVPPPPVTPVASKDGSLKREIRLEPEDWYVASWKELQPLVKPAPAPFDKTNALERLHAVLASRHYADFSKARIPKFPSREEARFWIHAKLLDLRKKKGPEIIEFCETVDLSIEITLQDLNELTKNHDFLGPLVPCLAHYIHLDLSFWEKYPTTLHESYCKWELPFLTAEERRAKIEAIDRALSQGIPKDAEDTWSLQHYRAGAVGAGRKLIEDIKSLPDGYYSLKNSNYSNPWHCTRFLVCGLPSSLEVEAEVRRLRMIVPDHKVARLLLATTEYSCLDIIFATVFLHTSKEAATAYAKIIFLITAPEAAVHALDIRQNSKAPQIGQQWLDENPLHAVVGLTPVAMGSGKLAAAAQEHLQMIKKNGKSGLLQEAGTHLAELERNWLETTILASTEETPNEIPFADLPTDLQTSFAEPLKGNFRSKLGISPAALPPIIIQGKALATPEVEKVLHMLYLSSLEAQPALFKALKTHASATSLDAFAWKLFEKWTSLGAESKERWAMAALGHLGGDRSVLKLTPLIRDWPGESQHKRAVFGLDILRAIGSDTALMALNGISLKLKFAALKEKAKLMMEGIAGDRGLTRDQLADRIVPDCGLNAQGTRIFDFGPRQFKFVMGPESKPMIRDSAGKLKPDLPTPNQSDDKELAEATVSEWKLLKKVLRETLKIQGERLEQAMITGRRWSRDELQQLLVNHPLMVNLARQLIWADYGPGGVIQQTFRVTEDQTLADHEDEEITLQETAQVGIVHRAHLLDALANSWGELLSDYEIIPPFQQLNRGVYRPKTEDLKAEEITRFKGTQIPGISLYGILEKSGWLKDTPADAGGFAQHSRYFPAANVTAFIAYEPGLCIGWYEEPQEIARVYFTKGHVKPDYWGARHNKITLEKVDTVVASETLRLVHVLLSKAVT